MSLYYGDPEFFIQYSSTSFRKEQSVVSLLLMAINGWCTIYNLIKNMIISKEPPKITNYS